MDASLQWQVQWWGRRIVDAVVSTLMSSYVNVVVTTLFVIDDDTCRCTTRMSTSTDVRCRRRPVICRRSWKPSSYVRLCDSNVCVPACVSAHSLSWRLSQRPVPAILLRLSRHECLSLISPHLCAGVCLGIPVISNRALKSREISRENTGIFAHMWHQHSLLGVNQYEPLTLNDHWRSKAIKVAWPDFWIT